MQRSELIRERLFECIHNGELENEDMIKIASHLFTILNLKTLTDFAKENNMSYNGAKLQKSITLGNVKFIVNNE